MNENREFKLFDEYTSYITKRIMSKKKEIEVRDEYFSHLMEEYERQTHLGRSHIEAQVLSIEVMGDKDAIKEQFGKLYPVIPFQYIRSSLNFIIWGILLSSFHIEIFFDGFSSITLLIGSALLLYGLFKLRSTDKKINIAFFMNVILCVASVITAHIGRTLVDPTNYLIILGTVTALIGIVEYGFLFAGINNLCKSLQGNGLKKPNLLLGYISYFIFGLIIILAIYGAVVIVYFAPIFLIIALWQLRNAKKFLANESVEFELKTVITIGEKIVYCVLIVVLAVAPIISMFAVAGSQPKTEIFNPVDTEYSTDEVNQVKFEMVLLGMPEEPINDLPDSEIMNYKGATYLHISEESPCYLMTETGKKYILYTYQYFIFFFPEGSVRSLVCIEIDDDSSMNYRNGVYLEHYASDWTSRENSSGKGEFFLALCNKDTETVKSEIISTYEPKNMDSYSFTGFEFKFPRGSVSRRVYISDQSYIKDYGKNQMLGINGYFIYEANPITANWKSVNYVARQMSGENGMFSYTDTGNLHTFGISHSFDFRTEYLEPQN